MIDSKNLAKEAPETTIFARLTHDVILRTGDSGENLAILHCIGDEDRVFTVGYWLKPLNAKKRRLLWQYLFTGTTVRLVGQWEQHDWTDRHGLPHSWDFQAHYIETVPPPEA
ncbi:hypothetical protein Sj15T_09510 [Sphingobium sp. TA15]|uniref:Uncharacterized protein n=1 Tax=Sphingobium indicum (strain DSM 16413 / CCM 7287 / MTCC 6362 / UT26 / NBRC 101211 / UT26S) TaxID=452662 RepID=D4Z211_SPHIU|nr:hypothetical protein [Sphingobium indicum]BAI96643.1 hypothetical protein SJA_C1-18090 [Sphingobium indicum UT26S]BDD65930.1 hypothetical protein Sj15T_09510 [Sphingobium sp. TA15]